MDQHPADESASAGKDATGAGPAVLRSQVATACRILGREGISLSAYGHVSTRIPGTDDFFIKSRGPQEEGLEFATDADIVRMDASGELAEDAHRVSPPNEKHIHLAIYESRPDVGSVIHAHPELVVALTASGRAIQALYGAYDPAGLALIEGGLPIYPSSRLINDRDSGRAVADTMGKSSVCLLAGHGVAVAGADVEDAVMKAVALHGLARMNWLAAAVGSPAPISDADRLFWAERSAHLGAHTRVRDDGNRADWHYYNRRLQT